MTQAGVLLAIILSLAAIIATEKSDMKTYVTRTIEWDAAHRVLRHESKCSTLHGHRYKANITVSAEQLDDRDRVVDFGVIKERVGAWVDANWDHTTLLNEQDTELLAFVSREAMFRSGSSGLESPKKKPFAFQAEPTAETIAAVLAKVAVELLAPCEGIRVEQVQVFETPNCCATVTL